MAASSNKGNSGKGSDSSDSSKGSKGKTITDPNSPSGKPIIYTSGGQKYTKSITREGDKVTVSRNYLGGGSGGSGSAAAPSPVLTEKALETKELLRKLGEPAPSSQAAKEQQKIADIATLEYAKQHLKLSPGFREKVERAQEEELKRVKPGKGEATMHLGGQDFIVDYDIPKQEEAAALKEKSKWTRANEWIAERTTKKFMPEFEDVRTLEQEKKGVTLFDISPKSKKLYEKFSMPPEMTLGIKKRAYTYFREQPLNFAADYSLGLTTGGLGYYMKGAGAASKVFKVQLGVAGLTYFGVKGVEFYREPTLEGKGGILGQMGVELAAFGAGAKTATTLIPKIYHTFTSSNLKGLIKGYQNTLIIDIGGKYRGAKYKEFTVLTDFEKGLGTSQIKYKGYDIFVDRGPIESIAKFKKGAKLIDTKIIQDQQKPLDIKLDSKHTTREIKLINQDPDLLRSMLVHDELITGKYSGEDFFSDIFKTGSREIKINTRDFFTTVTVATDKIIKGKEAELFLNLANQKLFSKTTSAYFENIKPEFVFDEKIEPGKDFFGLEITKKGYKIDIGFESRWASKSARDRFLGGDYLFEEAPRKLGKKAALFDSDLITAPTKINIKTPKVEYPKISYDFSTPSLIDQLLPEQKIKIAPISKSKRDVSQIFNMDQNIFFDFSLDQKPLIDLGQDTKAKNILKQKPLIDVAQATENILDVFPDTRIDVAQRIDQSLGLDLTPRQQAEIIPKLPIPTFNFKLDIPKPDNRIVIRPFDFDLKFPDLKFSVSKFDTPFGKWRPVKWSIIPYSDPLSLFLTETRTGKKARHYPLKKKYLREYWDLVKSGSVFYPSWEMRKGKLKNILEVF